MPDFDVEAFLTELDRMGVKLTAIPLADRRLRVNRWCMLTATEYAQQIENLWVTQIGNASERIDVLAAHVNQNSAPSDRRSHQLESNAIRFAAAGRAEWSRMPQRPAAADPFANCKKDASANRNI